MSFSHWEELKWAKVSVTSTETVQCVWRWFVIHSHHVLLWWILKKLMRHVMHEEVYLTGRACMRKPELWKWPRKPILWLHDIQVAFISYSVCPLSYISQSYFSVLACFPFTGLILCLNKLSTSASVLCLCFIACFRTQDPRRVPAVSPEFPYSFFETSFLYVFGPNQWLK